MWYPRGETDRPPTMVCFIPRITGKRMDEQKAEGFSPRTDQTLAQVLDRSQVSGL